MSKCEVCNERRGLMVNYAPGSDVWMAHPECAARHFQARVSELEGIVDAYKANGTALKGEVARLIGERNDAAAESVENYKRASRYREALVRICDLDEVSSFSDTHLIAHEALNHKN